MRDFERDMITTFIMATIDTTIYKGYSLKKAKLFVKIKCECKFDCTKELMQDIMRLTESKYLFNQAYNNLQVGIFESRDKIKLINKKIEFDSETQSQE